jgi:uncharacterized protein YlxW (UPF0749 family)
MKKSSRWITAISLAGLLIVLGGAFSLAAGQAVDNQRVPKVTPEQQKQLEQLRQLGDRLQKDRAALHEAIDQYGWDSEQTDAAQEQLQRDRMEYRGLRRSLRAAGVAVPAPAGMSAGPGPGGSGRMVGRMKPCGRCGRHCANCACRCCLN